MNEVEEGLNHFCKAYEYLWRVVSGTQYYNYIKNKMYNLKVRGKKSYVLTVEPETAYFEEGESEWVAATVEMDEEDWKSVFRGEANLASVAAADRLVVNKDAQNTALALGMVVQLLSLLK